MTLIKKRAPRKSAAKRQRIATIEQLEQRQMLANWYVAPDGLVSNPGTLEAPWDIESALMGHRLDINGDLDWSGTSQVEPGDTIWLRGGTYYHPDRSPESISYRVYLEGAADAPIIVRPYAQERATIDGGLYVHNWFPSKHIQIRELEVITSENLTETRYTPEPGTRGNYYLDRPVGGISVTAGEDIKLINNVVHANLGGLNLWQNAEGDSEVYGNLIYDIGWEGSDRGHGHGMYTQNAPTSSKYITENIIFGNYGFNVQAYGSSRAYVDNYIIERNFFGPGHGPLGNSGDERVLLGTMNENSNNGFRVFDNVHYGSLLQIGYAGVGGDDLQVSRNYIVLGELHVGDSFTNALITDNFAWNELWDGGYTGRLAPAPEDGALIPSAPLVFLHPNKYDSNRANLAVLSFQEQTHAAVDIGSSMQIKIGATFQLKAPDDFYGEPVFEGTYAGDPVLIPTTGIYTTYVLLIQPSSNQVPQAVDDEYEAVENTAIVVNQAQGILANDADADEDTLSASLASAPSHGIVALNTNGSFTYTPNAGFTGTDSFTYRASDGQDPSNLATVTLNVVAAGPVNNPPTATGDAYDAYQGMPLSVSATNGVLDNDADADQDTLSASLVSGPSHGIVAFSANGSFTYSPNAGFSGTDSFTYRANDGQDNSSAATVTLDVTPLTALGAIGFREINDLDLTGGDRWYGVQASRQGYFTIAALFTGSTDNLQVTLYDANYGELASSSPAAGGERIDWQASAGATYYFSVAGSIADVDLRLANLVQLQGDAVTVNGTAAVDNFEFTASSPYLVAINGVEYQFDPATVASVAFDGAAGDDTAVLTGSTADDTAIVYPNRGVMRGTGYEVNVVGTTSIAVHGGGGTSDVAHLYDSSGDDVFTSSPNTGTLSGTGFSNSAAGFYYVHGYGKAGGLDTATFYDSSGDDKFNGRPQYSKMEGPGFYNRGKTFDQVYAYSSTGNDQAHLRGSRSSEVFYAYADGETIASHLPETLDAAAVPLATSTLGEMIGTDFYYNARGFKYLHGYALQGGTDEAHMYDSSANDSFITNPAMKFGKLYDEGRTYQTRAKFFDFVNAYATGGGNDTAVLYGSGGDDIFVGRSDYSRMIGPKFNYRAKLFENVYGNAGNGGNDQAFLYDSTGDDLLGASGRRAKMSYGQTWVEAARFAWVQANSKSGGSDTKHEDSTDFVLQAEGPWVDI